MMRTMLLFSLCAFAFPFAAPAQPPARPVSPEISSDNHVSFRFPAPNALKVELSIEGQPVPSAMKKDEHGVWSATIGPLAPDIYGYSFIADGVALIDPANPLMKPNLLNTQSAVHVPGPATLPWEVNDRPRGEIHHHFYHSKIAADDHDFYVYTPPGYTPAGGDDYPVLYLLHGFSDDASGWTAVGRAHVILDNLIAAGTAKPMIVVMPLGYGDLDLVRRGWGSWRDKELAWRNFSNFRALLLSEVLPRVESSYRVKKDRGSRAIAGLSMGGSESLLTGLNHLEQFAWVGAFSSGGLDVREFGAEFPGLDEKANQKLRLLWIACGTDDTLIRLNRQFKSWLKDKGVAYTDIETPGAHTWMVWRRNLAALAPLLFRDKP
ncbi:MAG: esterase [Acidobacteria bacterium]|nr:esterase [Acidobacteriota bacterium]MBV9623780.1 esterase [Acidobacteriota bacterium]